MQKTKERYIHLNVEFQVITTINKEAFLSDQCKEIEGNNNMGKTRDIFKKIRGTKVTFYAKMGTIKDRNWMDLTVGENIKKRWQECTEELHKKDLHDPDYLNGVIPHLEPGLLKFEVKWETSLRKHHYKDRRGVEFQLILNFKILKDDVV